MPEGWFKVRDVARLADTGAEFDEAVPFGALQGVPEGYGDGGAPLQLRARFGREQGVTVVDLSLRGVLAAVCQHCLQPMRLPIDTQSHVALVPDENSAERLAANWETYLAAEGRISLAALAAEELMLALPLVPRHEESEACAAAFTRPSAAPPASDAAVSVAPVSGAAAEREDEERQRPFADLKALMARDRNRRPE